MTRTIVREVDHGSLGQDCHGSCRSPEERRSDFGTRDGIESLPSDHDGRVSVGSKGLGPVPVDLLSVGSGVSREIETLISPTLTHTRGGGSPKHWNPASDHP